MVKRGNKIGSMKMAIEMIRGISHLFFPRTCAGCGTELPEAGQCLCLRCIHNLPLTHFERHPENPIEKLFRGRVPIVAASAFCYFSKDSSLQNIMHEFKYQGKREIGECLGRKMGSSLHQSMRFNSIDAIVPLPLFASREKKRGYNQASILCEGIGHAFKLPVLNQAIMRTTATKTQTHKNRINRWQNMQGKFQLAERDRLANKHLLLVDDIITTGATLDACANELLKAEGSRVSIVALAYTEASN
jgi:ComF family protein